MLKEWFVKSRNACILRQKVDKLVEKFVWTISKWRKDSCTFEGRGKLLSTEKLMDNKVTQILQAQVYDL